MDSSVFLEKENIPNNEVLSEVLGNKFAFWVAIRDVVFRKYPEAKEEWNFPGKKYGWSFRIKDKKRAIIYLLPRAGFFYVAFVFGKRAYEDILCSNVKDEIKKELEEAKVYAEGRGIRIPIHDMSDLPDIKTLIDIKLKY